MSESPQGFQEGDATEKITFGKIGSFLKSAWSKGVTSKRVDDDTKYLRWVSCHGDESLGISPCEWRRLSEHAEGVFYCGRCGCGDSPKTWLNGPEGEYTKLDYPNVVCPLEMPGFNNHTPYGQEEKDIAKEFVTARKMNVEFTLFGKGFDVSHHGMAPEPNVEQVKEPQKPKRGCKTCGRTAEQMEQRPCQSCNKQNPPAPPPPLPEERIKNNIDDINLG